MSFLDSVKETGKIAAGKAKQYADLAGLKTQLSGSNAKLKVAYQKIGEIYYEKYGSDPDFDYADACEDVRKALAEIEELQEKIDAMKNA